ncbi:MAG: hypothetical protein ACP5G1_01390 [Nanopusillaceae archaeon]
MNILREMITDKVGIVLLIIFSIIGYYYYKSNIIYLLIYPSYYLIIFYIFIILFVLNFSLLAYIIIKAKRFWKGSLLSFISSILGFGALQACLVSCSFSIFSVYLTILSSILGITVTTLGLYLLIISDILFLVNLYVLIKKNNFTKSKEITFKVKRIDLGKCCEA